MNNERYVFLKKSQVSMYQKITTKLQQKDTLVAINCNIFCSIVTVQGNHHIF